MKLQNLPYEALTRKPIKTITLAKLIVSIFCSIWMKLATKILVILFLSLLQRFSDAVLFVTFFGFLNCIYVDSFDNIFFLLVPLLLYLLEIMLNPFNLSLDLVCSIDVFTMGFNNQLNAFSSMNTM